MDKQKQIEEMARIIAFDLCPNRHVHAKWGEEAQCYSDNNFSECTKIKNVVDKLYNAGYRKESKTVEKFAEKLKEKRFDEYSPEGKCYECVAVSDIDETCKEFTEGEYGESLCEE